MPCCLTVGLLSVSGSLGCSWSNGPSESVGAQSGERQVASSGLAVLGSMTMPKDLIVGPAAETLAAEMVVGSCSLCFLGFGVFGFSWHSPSVDPFVVVGSQRSPSTDGEEKRQQSRGGGWERTVPGGALKVGWSLRWLPMLWTSNWAGRPKVGWQQGGTCWRWLPIPMPGGALKMGWSLRWLPIPWRWWLPMLWSSK